MKRYNPTQTNIIGGHMNGGSAVFGGRSTGNSQLGVSYQSK